MGSVAEQYVQLYRTMHRAYDAAAVQSRAVCEETNAKRQWLLGRPT